RLVPGAEEEESELRSDWQAEACPTKAVGAGAFDGDDGCGARGTERWRTATGDGGVSRGGDGRASTRPRAGSRRKRAASWRGGATRRRGLAICASTRATRGKRRRAGSC